MTFVEKFLNLVKNYPIVKSREDIINDINFRINPFFPDFDYRSDVIEDETIHYVFLYDGVDDDFKIHLDFYECYWGSHELNSLLKENNYRIEWIHPSSIALISIDDNEK